MIGKVQTQDQGIQAFVIRLVLLYGKETLALKGQRKDYLKQLKCECSDGYAASPCVNIATRISDDLQRLPASATKRAKQD